MSMKVRRDVFVGSVRWKSQVDVSMGLKSQSSKWCHLLFEVLLQTPTSSVIFDHCDFLIF